MSICSVANSTDCNTGTCSNQDITAIEELTLRPCVPMYHPSTLKGLKPGKVYSWCTCGLSRKQPWCDGKSHERTRFKPLEWKVPGFVNGQGQRIYSICNCKYTRQPPYCDGVHYDLPLKYLAQIKACTFTHDPTTMILCEHCGWKSPLDTSSSITTTTTTSNSSSSSSNSEEEEGDEQVILHDSGTIEMVTTSVKQ
ncbi:hypothetical protein BDF22DRAFT_703837 [Syncephalis plumigaleata]|nr:hypothetical protein BDF22DRAFT_703837 [Syncephalis plumigaleata]